MLEDIEFDAVAPTFLCAVEACVRGVDKLHCGTRVRFSGKDRTDADRDGKALVFQLNEMVADGLKQRIRNDLGRIATGKHDGKLFAAPSADVADGPDGGCDHLRNLPEHSVALEVSAAVVDLLKVVDVQNDERQAFLLAAEVPVHPLVKTVPAVTCVSASWE